MFTDIEQETLDIEWFFTNGHEIGFVASGGGKLPNSVSNRSPEEIELLVDYFRSLPQRNSVKINPNLKRFITSGTNEKQYRSYFSELAEKGLFTFDKTVSNMFSDEKYHLVADPSMPFRFDQLPSEISMLIVETKINGEIGDSLNISDIQ